MTGSFNPGSPKAVTPAAPAVSRVDARVPALDGLRGTATVMVVLSHFFGEVPHGLALFKVGWIAVDVFFVLSGYLVGKLILERMHCSNFFTVFYIRRLCRTVPSYILITCLVYLMFALVDPPKIWMQYEPEFSVWSYVSFTQNFHMAALNEVGPHWLSPYWTLAVEEHFYLVGPAFLVFVARRWMVPILVVTAILAVLFRFYAVVTTEENMFAVVLLPGRMDSLIMGILAAILVTRDSVDWAKYEVWLRVIPTIALVATALLGLFAKGLVIIFGHFIVSFGAAAYILMLVQGLPESKRMNSKLLIFFADTSYATYLTHVAVLGTVHGLFLGSLPDIGNLAQVAVTLIALPVTVAVGWLLTRYVEMPISAYGRSWKWRELTSQGELTGSTDAHLRNRK